MVAVSRGLRADGTGTKGKAQPILSPALIPPFLRKKAHTELEQHQAPLFSRFCEDLRPVDQGRDLHADRAGPVGLPPDHDHLGCCKVRRCSIILFKIVLFCRSKENCSAHLTYVAQLVGLANSISVSSDKLVPVGSILVKALGQVATRLVNFRIPPDADVAVKALDVELVSKLKERQMTESVATWKSIAKVISHRVLEHLAVLSGSPAYPEISFPVIRHVRRIIKQCPLHYTNLYELRTALKQIVTVAEASAQAVVQKRASLVIEAGGLVRPVDKFRIYQTGDFQVGQLYLREEANRAKAEEQKANVEITAKLVEARRIKKKAKKSVKVQGVVKQPTKVVEGGKTKTTEVKNLKKVKKTEVAAKKVKKTEGSVKSVKKVKKINNDVKRSD